MECLICFEEKNFYDSRCRVCSHIICIDCAGRLTFCPFCRTPTIDILDQLREQNHVLFIQRINRAYADLFSPPPTPMPTPYYPAMHEDNLLSSDDDDLPPNAPELYRQDAFEEENEDDFAASLPPPRQRPRSV